MSIDILYYALGKAAGGGGGGGGQTLRERWDFTGEDPKVGKLLGWTGTAGGSVAFGATGAVFASTSDYLALMAIRNDFAIEVDVGEMSLASGTHRRFVMSNVNCGLIYRNTGCWAFYTPNGAWQDTEETDGTFFANSTVKVVIDKESKWHVYKNGVLFYEPTVALPIMGYRPGTSNEQAYVALRIGSDSNSINNATIKAVRLYF